MRYLQDAHSRVRKMSLRGRARRTNQKEQSMLKKVRDYIIEWDMIHPGDRLILGLSGGRDSVCLFHVLRKLGPEMGFSFSAVHVNHGIRGEEAGRDEQFAEALCERYGIPLRIVRASVPELAAEKNLSLEEAGRLLRREVFEEECRLEGAQKIALAHHKNDVAETVLFNIARGSGIGGLSSLRPVRERYIRPLLGVTRGEIDRFLSENGYGFVEDSTNADVSYSRNRIRNDILPMFMQFVNARTVDHLAGLSETAARTADFLAEEVSRCVSEYSGRPGDACSDGEVLISDLLFEKEAAILQELSVREAAGRMAGTFVDIDRRHVTAILGLYGRKAGKRICLPYSMEAVRTGSGILIRKSLKKEGPEDSGDARSVREADEAVEQGEKNIPIPLRIPGVTTAGDICFRCDLAPDCGEPIPQNMYTKWFDYDKINGILEIRVRKKGDYMVISPSGHRKKFSDLLIDRKIPREKRDEIPLICAGAEVLWAVGIRSGESCRVDETTKTVLRISAEILQDEGFLTIY